MLGGDRRIIGWPATVGCASLMKVYRSEDLVYFCLCIYDMCDLQTSRLEHHFEMLRTSQSNCWLLSGRWNAASSSPCAIFSRVYGSGGGEG